MPGTQYCSSPSWQAAQVRQLSTMQPTPTRSPCLKRLTLAPTAVTTPAIS